MKLSRKHTALLFLALVFISSAVSGRNDTIPDRTGSGIYFVRENDIIDTLQYLLISSIRPIDKMDIDTSTIEINSAGEGWLDIDSIPTGKWKFYAEDNAGKKYIFKEGNYVRSLPSMFLISGDTDELINLFGNIIDPLLIQQVKYIPFVKSGVWTYYHSNGKIWKKVTFRSSEIPIEFVIAEIDGGEQLLFPVNDDEPIEGMVQEFNSRGKLFKELYYMGFNKVSQKISYDENGNKTIRDYYSDYNEISPTNY